MSQYVITLFVQFVSTPKDSSTFIATIADEPHVGTIGLHVASHPIAVWRHIKESHGDGLHT